MAEVRRRKEAFDEQHCTMVIVTFLPVTELAAFRAQHHLDFPVLGDPDRQVYRLYGLQRGTWRQVLHPRGIGAYWKAWRRGIPIRRPHGGDDVLQLGGDFLIDPQGRIRLAHYSHDPADRPSADQLLSALSPSHGDGPR